MLADAAGWFFPITSLSAATVERARALIALNGLDGSLRRTVVDMTDELERRLAVVEKYTRPH